jgi:hypothetical protein
MAAARRGRFVGRLEELALFRSALLNREPSFAVLHIHGPGGVGKTTLLREFARLAAECGRPVVWLDGRHIDPTSPGFLLAVQHAMQPGGSDTSGGVASCDELDWPPAATLLIDTYEALTPLDAWLRETFLPRLPARSLIVIAGRNPPTPAWRTDLDWAALTHCLSLRNLRPEESLTYLATRGIPADRHANVLDFSHGHPLALALGADLLAGGERQTLNLTQEPDVARVLLELFVQQVPSPAHRRALETCARARVTTEELLADVVGHADAPALFAWLRGLSFIEQGPEGLFPHDVARDALDADLRWRDPAGFRELHDRLLHRLARQIQALDGRKQQRAYFDILYLSRHSAAMRSFYDWEALGNAWAEPATPADGPGILEIVRRHEGDVSARIAAHWLARQPEAFYAFRSPGQQLTGFTAALLLEEANPVDCAVDPAVSAAWAAAQPRPGERVLHHRFYLDREQYQASRSAHNLISAVAGIRWLTVPRLAWCFTTLAEPQYWHPMFSALNFQRVPAAEFDVDGRHFGVYGHDWRAEPVQDWIVRKGGLDPDTQPTVEARLRAPLLVLSQPDFEDAVRRALRDYGRPAALAANPLARARVVADRVNDDDSIDALQTLLRDAVATLAVNPKDLKFHRALWHTYIEPALTQERAAELLDVPFNTYRYHLNVGLERVTAWLWQRELGDLNP